MCIGFVRLGRSAFERLSRRQLCSPSVNLTAVEPTNGIYRGAALLHSAAPHGSR